MIDLKSKNLILKKFIESVILQEAAKRPEDLPDDTYILVRRGEYGGSATYRPTVRRQKQSVIGMVTWKANDNKPNTVDVATVDSGWGPLLYDIAVEASGEIGLMSDRHEVSQEAKRIWDFYRDRRPDVEKIQYDNLENELTPHEWDNVNQQNAQEDAGVSKWYQSSLSKAYKKLETPIIDKLFSMGKIKIEDYTEDFE